jgi:hypothetical protein
MIGDSEVLLRLFEACLDREYSEVENGGSFATLRDGGILYVFFEKSNGEVDWRNNFGYHSVRYPRVGESWFCHEGFLRVWESILPHISHDIDEARDGVVCVGYSHGAALALLCHEYVWYKRPELRENSFGVGFGCPRVIWGRVPQESERWRNFFVVRNLDDLVTHLPPTLFGYRHVGNLVEIGRGGRHSMIDAHREENYINALKDAILPQ